MKTIEITSPALPADIREFRNQERFVVVSEDGETTSEPMTYREAIWRANGLPGLPAVCFVTEDEVPESAPDYSEPVPTYMGKRRKR